MVNINELRFSVDGDYIILDASVPYAEYTENVYISSVIVNNSSQFSSNGPNADKYVFKKDFDEDREEVSVNGICGCIRAESDEPSDIGGDYVENKRIRIDIPLTDKDDIHFVYVVTSGDYGIGVPCGEDNNTTLGIIYDKERLYSIGMEHIKEVEKSCSVPYRFIDYMCREKVFHLAIETGNYIKAIKYWNNFRKEKTSIHDRKNCNCYD